MISFVFLMIMHKIGNQKLDTLNIIQNIEINKIASAALGCKLKFLDS